MRHWYAFQSKARREHFLCEQLRIREIETFLPAIHGGAGIPGFRKSKPYFPGYVFIQIDLEQSGRSMLEWIPGAVGIVSVGGEPAAVSDQLIDALQRHIYSLNASGRRIASMFRQGEVISIAHGPFAGYEAIFDTRLPGRNRVEVLINMLQGSQLRVELPLEHIVLR